MSQRKVHFSVPLHQIEYFEDKQWETASRQARDGSDWLRMGIDRQRFKDRIERIAEILDRILDSDFRQQIYRERFENFDLSSTSEKSTSKKDQEKSEEESRSTRTALAATELATSQTDNENATDLLLQDQLQKSTIEERQGNNQATSANKKRRRKSAKKNYRKRKRHINSRKRRRRGRR